MRKLSQDSKAVWSAATLVLVAFASAHAGALDLQLQRLDNCALRSHGLSAPAALHRLPPTRSHSKLAKNRRSSGEGIADTSLMSFATRLHFAGVTSGEVPCASEPWRGTSLLPRAPPLS